MRSFIFSAVFLCSAGALCAEVVGAQSGCEVTATALRGNCEMVQVLRCEAEGPQKADIYLGDKFLGEEAWEGVEMVRWRRGNMLQEISPKAGDFAALAAMAEGEVLEVQADRSRRMTGTDAPAMVDAFTYQIEALGEGRRALASGQNRLVKRFRYGYASPGGESGERVIEYDPALGLPIWGEGWKARAVLDVFGPEHASFMQGAAPEGAGCTPE